MGIENGSYVWLQFVKMVHIYYQPLSTKLSLATSKILGLMISTKKTLLVILQALQVGKQMTNLDIAG